MNQTTNNGSNMKRRTFTLGVAVGAASLFSGCGGGSSSGGTVFLKDVSGTWQEIGGQLGNAVLTLVQSGKAVSGSITFPGSSAGTSLAGTKDGNDVDLTGSLNGSAVTYTLHETLVSPSQMSGKFTTSGNGSSISVPTTFAKVS